MITDPKLQQQYLQEARARGMSQGKIDTFLKENPNDYHRLKDVESDGQKPPSEAGPTAGTPGGGTALSGLMGTAPQLAPGVGGGATQAVVSGVSTPEPITADFAGQLPMRGNLGTRMYPQESYILASLRRAY